MDGEFQRKTESLLKKGERMLLCRPLGEVFPVLDKAYRLARDYNFTAGRFRAAYLLARYYLMAGNNSAAYGYSTEALDLSRESGDHPRYIRAAWLHGCICCNTGRLMEAGEIANTALGYAAQYQDTVSQGLLLTILAHICMENVQEQEAYELLLKSEELFKAHTRSESYGFLLSMWGDYYRGQNKRELFGHYTGKAMEFFAKRNDRYHEMNERARLYITPLSGIDRSIAELRQIRETAREYGYHGIEFTISVSLGQHCFKQGNLPDSLDNLDYAIRLSREKQVSQNTADVLKGIALIHQKRGSFDTALSYLRQALDACGEANSMKRTEILLLLSYVLVKLNDIDAAESVYAQGAALAAVFDYPTNKYFAAVCHGKIHEAKSVYKLAEQSYFNALAIARDLRNRSLEGSALLYIAELYLSLHEDLKARKYFEELLSLATETGAKTLELRALLGLAMAARNSGSPEAIDLFLRVYDTASELSLQPEIMNAGKNLSELFLAENRLSEAFHYFRIYHETRNSIHNDKNTGELKKISDLFSVIPLEQMHRKEKEKVRELEAELERKSKEAALLSLQLTQKDKILDELRSRIGDLQRSKGQSPETHEMLKILQSESSPIAASKAFRDHVMNSRPEFMQKLLDLNEHLTPTEVKICSLLRMNLTSKEISEILHVSVNNVEIHRVHIRKKLGLPRKISLLSYLGRM